MTFFIKTKTSRRDGRSSDIKELKMGMKSSNRRVREIATESADRIRKESGKIKSMREALIREHRAGRTDNVKDIHETVRKDPGTYLNRI